MVVVFRHVGWQVRNGADQVAKLLGQRLSLIDLG